MTRTANACGAAIVAVLLGIVTGCSKDSPAGPSPTPNCTFTVTGMPSGSVAAGTSEFTLSIATQAGCAWTASSGSPFITAVGATSGTGNGSVKFTIQPNSGDARQGTVQVAGQTITLTQPAGSPGACDFTVSPASPSVSPQGGDITVTVTVTRGDNCAWTATSNDAFITVKQGASGTGGGTVVLTVAANEGAARSGSATIAGSAVAISQGAAGSSPGRNPVAVLAYASDPGDQIGGGQSVTYTLSTSQFSLVADPTRRAFGINIKPPETWSLYMNVGSGQLAPGVYAIASRFGPVFTNGLSFLRLGQDCSSIAGRFLISEAVYGAAGVLDRFHARFEQHCNGTSAALHGEIWIDSEGDTTPPPLPPFPPSPPPTTFLTIQSDPDDFVGQGGSATYTLPGSAFVQYVAPGQPRVHLVVTSPAGMTPPADASWQLDFTGPSGTLLVPGIYDPAPNTPGQPAGSAGFSIAGRFTGGNGRGCTSSGKFTVLEAVYDSAGVILRFHATFEQHCLSGVPALRGEIYIVADPWR